MSTTNDPIFTVTCPGCGQEAQKTIAWLKEDGHFLCAGCGNSVHFDGAAILSEMQPDFSDGVAKISREIQRINRLTKL